MDQCPSKSCSCLLLAGAEKSICGREEGPFVYSCPKGCCSQDCEAVRGTLTAGRLAPETSIFEKFDTFRERLRRQLFGDMPTGPIALVFVLIVVIILAFANMLKDTGRRR